MKHSQSPSPIENKRWPIVYHPKYNLHVCGLNACHPIDPYKWRRIFDNISKGMGLTENDIYLSREAEVDELLIAHSSKYLKKLTWSCTIARITDLCYLAIFPNCLLQRMLLKPLRYQTYGTLLAGHLALQRGWAINVGGGFHHCSANKASGFCFYADITLLVKYTFTYQSERIKKVMIVDLGAHRGNGYAMDLSENANVFIMDVYNPLTYPFGFETDANINCKVELKRRTKDFEYLNKVEQNLLQSLNKFTPDLLIYVAGTDILAGDPSGRLLISPEGVIKRDQLVFVICRQRRVPIVMLTSSGYLKKSGEVVAQSIKNLKHLGIIGGN